MFGNFTDYKLAEIFTRHNIPQSGNTTPHTFEIPLLHV